uniref:NfeD family protein n=1 Tax=Ningiella ruwaisensis TaxID=2364274 RepID=UPI00109F5E85|nr:NfeD family protein [Ningiella ruwaisensis]
MTWFSEHYAETLLVIGLVLLAIEILVLGFSTFFVFFIGLATVVTAALIYFGILPDTWLASLGSIAVFTGVFAALLWKKLRKLQNHVDTKQADNDIVGHVFICPDDIDPTKPQAQLPSYQYSGINWRLSSDSEISRGTKVRVKHTEVGLLHVEVAS